MTIGKVVPKEDLNWSVEERKLYPNLETEQRSCTDCYQCCENYPGAFKPGEVERAADLLKITPEEFVDQYCIVDWVPIEDLSDPAYTVIVQMFAPARVDAAGVPVEPTGHRVSPMYPVKPADRCIFLNRSADRSKGESPCMIYSARPYECRQYHCKNWDWQNPKKPETAKDWINAMEVRRISLEQVRADFRKTSVNKIDLIKKEE